MSQSDVEVTPYSEADVETLAAIHLAAFKGYMNSRMGKKYVRAFLRWFLTYPNSIALKATLRGAAIGYVVGAPLGYAQPMNRSLLKIGIYSIISHPHVLLHPNFTRAASAKLRLLLGRKPASITLKQPEGKGISLVGIGVHPQSSGNGVGTAIMKAFENKARVIGMDYMRLSVYDHNEVARAVYEKSGWKMAERVGNALYYQKSLT